MPNYQWQNYVRNRRYMTFYLGKLYIINGILRRFELITKKGFGFVDVDTGDRINKKLLYDRRWKKGIPVPKNNTQFAKVLMPDWYKVQELTIEEV